MSKHHPIQLLDIKISRLNIVINDHEKSEDYGGEIKLSIQTATTDFNKEASLIPIGLRASCIPDDNEDEEPCFLIEVEIHGVFEVNQDEFPIEHLEEWSEVNAPYLLLPYLREQVYGLALRAGIKGLILPLFTQPDRLVVNKS